MFYYITNSGFSLIEVLISLLLVSLILFGLDAAEMDSIRESKIALLSGTAMHQLENARARLVSLDNASGLDEEIRIWNDENKTVLPEGFGTITGFFPDYIVTIYWGKKSHDCNQQQTGLSGCFRQKIQLA